MAEYIYPERTVASPPGQRITVGLRVPRDARDPRHGMRVRCGPGAFPGTARDRLSAVLEGFNRVPFGKIEKHCPRGTAAEVTRSSRLPVEAGRRSFSLIPVADSEQAAIDGAVRVRALLEVL